MHHLKVQSAKARDLKHRRDRDDVVTQDSDFRNAFAV
jgi:hypothetical protein